MCGITGAVWHDPKLSVEARTLDRMIEALRHRGPDDVGTVRFDHQPAAPHRPCPGAALGVRRLSIIDPAGGHQPLANEDESVWVAFNGEIYNFPALRRRLEGAGHRFRTGSDTEVLVHLYEDEGVNAFAHLNGMFALAIWDRPRRRCILARDRLGQKPLYYWHQPGRLSFASELKGLTCLPDFSREIDPSAIDSFLTYQYILPPHTIYRQVRKLPPGAYLTYRDDQVDVDAYWAVPAAERDLPTNEARRRLAELLRSSVEMRLRADTPVGAFLSGGIDSSLTVALMRELSHANLKTFSIGFAESDYDETRYAQMVAKHLGVQHHRAICTADQVAELLPRLVWHFDEPFGDPSALPTWCLSELTAGEVKVALSGDGGDELFAGYPRYRAVALAARIDRFRPLKWLAGAPLWQKLPSRGEQKGRLQRAKRFCSALRSSPGRRYLDWMSIFVESARGALYREDFLTQLDRDPGDFLLAAWQRYSRRDAVTTATLTDLVSYLPGDLLTKVDVASMAHGLEGRQRLLDHRVGELAAALPLGQKCRRGTGKRILRQTFGPLLPDEVWNRPKMGFGVPLDRWFREKLRPLLVESLLATDAHVNQFLQPAAVRRMVDEHHSGRLDHSHRLWCLLMLETWLREWGPQSSETPASVHRFD